MNPNNIDLSGIGVSEEKKVSEETPIHDAFANKNTNESYNVEQENVDLLEEDNISINITIQNKKVPIVLLFGPASCGKSMTLVRLSRYIHKKGLTVDTVANFRSGTSYIETCNHFKNNLDTETPVPGTKREEFLLLEVRDKGNLVCYFLEAPGEHYFPEIRKDFSYIPPYMTQIINRLPNQKIWIYILEAGWSKSLHKKYVDRIKLFRNKFRGKKDRHILLHNKIDKKDMLFNSGKLNRKAAERDMFEEYETLLSLFKNENIFTRHFLPYKVTYVPFSTGSYSESEDGTKIYYTESKDAYPELLWKEILNCKQGNGYE